MTAKVSGRDEAARLRACREAFELSIARGVTMAEARAMVAKARWEAAEARLSTRRCGTRDAAVAVSYGGDDSGERTLAWVAAMSALLIVSWPVSRVGPTILAVTSRQARVAPASLRLPRMPLPENSVPEALIGALSRDAGE